MVSSLVTQVRNLQRRKGRARSGSTVAEGVRLVREALDAGVRFRGVLAARGLAVQPRAAALLQRLAGHAVPIEEIPAREFAKLAATETPQGVLAVIDPRVWRPEDIPAGAAAPVLVLDGVQDPGNVGTLLRTAFALGAAGAMLLPGTADIWNPKALRAAMGATFKFPTVAVQDEEFVSWVTARGGNVWVAAAEGKPLSRMSGERPVALVVGNEGAGVRPSLRSMARHRVAIPLARGAESLNVAVAAGILLHEVMRDA